MFTHVHQQIDQLQRQLDRERELFDRQARHEEIAQPPGAFVGGAIAPTGSVDAGFVMVELYTIIPDCNIEPIRMEAHRAPIRQRG